LFLFPDFFFLLPCPWIVLMTFSAPGPFSGAPPFIGVWQFYTIFLVSCRFSPHFFLKPHCQCSNCHLCRVGPPKSSFPWKSGFYSYPAPFLLAPLYAQQELCAVSLIVWSPTTDFYRLRKSFHRVISPALPFLWGFLLFPFCKFFKVGLGGTRGGNVPPQLGRTSNTTGIGPPALL